MLRLLMTAAATLASAMALSAEPPTKSDTAPMPTPAQAKAKAIAALALAKARANAPTVIAATKPIPYADAKKIAKREGKPIFVSIGLECSGLCSDLRPEFLTCHEKEFEGDKTPRAVLILPGKNRDLFRVTTWPTMPTADQVRQVAVEWKKKISADVDADQPTRSDRSRSDRSDRSDALASVIALGLVGVQPAEWMRQPLNVGNCPCAGTGGCRCLPHSLCADGQCANHNPLLQVQFQQNCPGGVCPAPESGAFASSVPSASSAPGRLFHGRFPRVAAIRGRLRGVFGRLFPRLAGRGYSYAPAPMTATSGPAVAAAGMPASSDAVMVAAARAAVGERLTPEKIRRLRAAGLDLEKLIQLILKYGPAVVDLILEIIEKFKNVDVQQSPEKVGAAGWSAAVRHSLAA